MRITFDTTKAKGAQLGSFFVVRWSTPTAKDRVQHPFIVATGEQSFLHPAAVVSVEADCTVDVPDPSDERQAERTMRFCRKLPTFGFLLFVPASDAFLVFDPYHDAPPFNPRHSIAQELVSQMVVCYS